MISYAHDVRYMKERPPLREYLAYFFILPNFYFPLFPVIDYKTMRLSYYRRDIHEWRSRASPGSAAEHPTCCSTGWCILS